LSGIRVKRVRKKNSRATANQKGNNEGHERISPFWVNALRLGAIMFLVASRGQGMASSPAGWRE
jgi:hypothetical protein